MKYDNVKIYDTETDVKSALCEEFVATAEAAISRKGNFYAAVPGGSVLKMLSGLVEFKEKVDWTKVFLFYVNHKVNSISNSQSNLKDFCCECIDDNVAITHSLLY